MKRHGRAAIDSLVFLLLAGWLLWGLLNAASGSDWTDLAPKQYTDWSLLIPEGVGQAQEAPDSDDATGDETPPTVVTPAEGTRTEVAANASVREAASESTASGTETLSGTSSTPGRATRLVVVTAGWCVPCQQIKLVLEEALSTLRRNGWAIGPDDGAHLQILDADADAGTVERLGLAGEPLPLIAGFERGRLVRRWDRQSPPDVWTLGYLAKGRDERPTDTALTWTVRRSEDGAQAPTPHVQVATMLSVLRPQPHETLIDPGCGDGRALIAAVRGYGCRAIGIEIDPAQAAKARAAVEASGLSDRITVVEGDARTVDWGPASVGFVYLYPDLLAELRPKLERLDRCVSYMHQVPGMAMTSYNRGEFYHWQRPRLMMQQSQRAVQSRVSPQRATGPYCNNPNCAMCAAIRAGTWRW